ncbi:permease, partial [bacterium]|nr:permease [bacterium]
AGDMFEIGAKVQVLKKGVLFPARANKLYAIYRQYDRIEDIPETIRRQIEEPYFKSTFETVWMELKNKFRSEGKADEIEKLERMPKQKMAAIFRRYFQYSSRITFDGDIRDKTDFQIHTGPALGAFNQWVKGTDLESWRNRYVAKIAVSMMTAAAQHLSERISQISGVPDA